MPRYDIDRLDNRDPERIRLAYQLISPVLRWYFRPVIRGIERIPDGPGLYVGNHNGGIMTFDSFTLFAEIYRQRGLSDVPYGLGHEVAIALPVFREIVIPLGAIRASHETAHAAFLAGHKVLVYPGSDYDAFRPYRDRNRIVFGPRRGYVRLALRERVPIIPIVTAGAHEVLYILSDGRTLARWLPLAKLIRAKAWPIALTFPWGLTIGPPPPYIPRRSQFFQEVLEPIRFERDGAEAASDDDWVEACHQRVLGTMQEAMDRLARERERAS
ncbi:MAG: lysophospholipid acyltransferase family protein [Myxococcota bacterium]